MKQRSRSAAVLVGLGMALLGSAAQGAIVDRKGPVVLELRTIATAVGARPFHLIRFRPGAGARIETAWLGGGPGKAGTVGQYVNRNARRGAVGGINGTFFLLTSNSPSCGFVLHNGLNRTGTNPTGSGSEVAFAPDGTTTPSTDRPFDFFGRTGKFVKVNGQFAGVWKTREATCGKPVVVRGGRAQTGPGGLSPEQASPSVHRSAVGVLKSGEAALVVAGGAGLPHAAFAKALATMGFSHALGLDLNSASTLDWKGRSVNRPGFERQIPTGIIVFTK